MPFQSRQFPPRRTTKIPSCPSTGAFRSLVLVMASSGRYSPSEMRPIFRRFVLATAVAATLAAGARAQQNPAVDHARRILDLLKQEKFDDVAKELNAQVAGLLPASQLAAAWKTLHDQFGALTSVTDEQVRTPRAGMTTVVLGCQFDKAALNVLVTFDADDRIAGLQMVPRQAAPPPPPRPSSD